MPNTLGHLGAGGLATRALLGDVDPRWIGFGCVAPDIPWILQRAAGQFLTVDARYDLRLYAIAQGSLLVSLILCLAGAVLARRPGRVFCILGLNVFVHLLLDALQKKYASGVHLLAPFSWRLLDRGLFWPESIASVALVVVGVLWALYALRRAGMSRAPVLALTPWRFGASGLLVGLYLLVPALLVEGPASADNHFVRTLRDVEHRAGRAVELDRPWYTPQNGPGKLTTFAGEELFVTGWSDDHPGTISVRGHFEDRTTVRVVDAHYHWPFYRDATSLAGLAVVLLLWALPLAGRRFHRGSGKS